MGKKSAYDLINSLKEGKNILLDGGVGTEIQRRGVETALPLWSASALLSNPEVVLQIHKDYISAGARIIKTNTFRTNRRALAKAGLGDRAFELTKIAVDLAKEAVSCFSSKIYIGGSAAPLEDCYSHHLVPCEKELIEEHTEHIKYLVEAGVDFIAIETINTISEAKASLKAALEMSMPAWISFVCNKEGTLLSGETISEAVKTVEPLKPFAILINCMPPDTIAKSLRKLRKSTNLSIGAYSNGLGKPHEKFGWTFDYCHTSLEKFVNTAAEWKKIGTQLIGTCCGATPDYTAALQKKLF